MGCSCSQNVKAEQKYEIVSQSVHPEDLKQVNIVPKLIDQIHNKFNELGFINYQFTKITQYELKYTAATMEWNFSRSKVILSKGIIQPLLIDQLKEAQAFIRQKQQSTLNESIKFEIVNLKCAISMNQSFPPLSFNYLGYRDRGPLIINQSYIVIRSWNMGEQMINFQSIVELVNQLQELMPKDKFQLIGVCRGTSEQKEPFDALIRMNGWNNYDHIFINQDEPNDESAILDVHYDQSSGEIIENNIISVMVIHPLGQVIFQEFQNDCGFGSDNDEVEPKIKLAIMDANNLQQQVNTQKQTSQSALEIEVLTYQKIKKLITTDILFNFQNKKFNRDMQFNLKKQIFYVDGQVSNKCIQQPTLQLMASKKTEQNINDLYALINYNLNDIPLKEKQKFLEPPIIWNIGIPINYIKMRLKQVDLQVRALLEQKIVILINQSEIIVSIIKWEDCPIVPIYINKINVSQLSCWFKSSSSLQRTIDSDQMSQAYKFKILKFFSQVPQSINVIGSCFNGLPQTIKRTPPYEEIYQQQDQLFTREQDTMLIVYYIDYENDSSLTILNSLVKQIKQVSFSYQFVLLSPTRAESWTKLFQAYVEKIGILPEIKSGQLITLFPISDQINSILYSQILRMVYGIQIEKKDLLITDKNGIIRVLDSTRNLETNFVQNLISINNQGVEQTQEDLLVDKLEYQQTFTHLKQLFKQKDQITSLCETIQKQITDESEYLLIEQKCKNIWDFECDEPKRIKQFLRPTITNRLQKDSRESYNKLEQLLKQKLDMSKFQLI